jgi:two-component system cell cycle sensor histidine kinase/response regulator CckA
MTDVKDPGRSGDGSAGTVLVVDDEAGLRAVERRVLEDQGYHVIEAASGAEGIDQLAGDMVVDLLIADLQMPGLGGEEMVRRIHLRRPGLPVLYVTGRIDRLMDARPLCDSEAFLEKPFTPSGLREAVSLLLNGSIAGPPRPA